MGPATSEGSELVLRPKDGQVQEVWLTNVGAVLRGERAPLQALARARIVGPKVRVTPCRSQHESCDH